MPTRLQRIHNLRLKVCGLSLLIIITVGSLGYYFIEGWSFCECLYMTVITITTVGFGELYPLSTAGRLFTMLLIIVGVGTVAVAVSIMFEAVFQRQMRLFMERRSMQKEIDTLTDHIVVCGYGRMGRSIAASLINTGRSVVIIESAPDILDELEREGQLCVKGDAADEAVLRRAGINHARALVATLGSDADNLFLTLTARGMNPDLDIIARSEEERNRPKFIQAGATRVVSPVATGAKHIVRLLTRPDVVDFVELVARDDDVQFEVSQITVDETTPFVGKTLADGHVRQKVGGMVLAIRKPDGDVLFDPKPNTKVTPGDVLLVVGASQRHPSAAKS